MALWKLYARGVFIQNPTFAGKPLKIMEYAGKNPAQKKGVDRKFHECYNRDKYKRKEEVNMLIFEICFDNCGYNLLAPEACGD